jgi:hypothetical protein
MDARSVYVGNLDYSVSRAELAALLARCGEVRRVSIPRDGDSHRPQGYAYVEFGELLAAETALRELDGHELCGRQLRVELKRTNLRGFNARARGGRGSSGGGRSAAAAASGGGDASGSVSGMLAEPGSSGGGGRRGRGGGRRGRGRGRRGGRRGGGAEGGGDDRDSGDGGGGLAVAPPSAGADGGEA